MSERSDTIVVFARRNRRGQRVSDTGQPLKIVMHHHVLEPEEVIRLNASANLNGLVDSPELVDVAHQIDIRADALAQYAHALDLAGDRWLSTHLRLHLLKAHLHQTRAGLGQIREWVRPHQGATGVGWGAVTVAPKQRVHRLPKRLALDVPESNVKRGHRERKNPARA